MAEISRDARNDLGRDAGRIDPQQGYAFMRAHQAEFPIATMCRALDLSTSGYYDWLHRTLPSEHALLTADHAMGGTPGNGSGDPEGRLG